MSNRLAALLALSGLTLVACSSASGGNGAGASSEDGGTDAVVATGDDGPATSVDGSVTTAQMVGAAGGTVTASGVALDFPAGALPSNTMITVTNVGVAPTGYVGLSPVFQFGPDGTVFQQPVTVSFTFSGGTSPAVFWSNAQGGYDELTTTTASTTATASVMHFSRGFCGESHKHQGMDATTTADGSGGSGDAAGGSSSGSASSGGSSSGGSSGSASSGSSGGSSSGSSSGGSSSGSSGSSGGSSGGSSSGSSTGSSSGSSSGSGSGSSGGSSGQGTDSGVPDDSGAADATSTADAGSSADAGSTTDAGSTADASTYGVTVAIDGVPKFFGYNVTASPLQAWWVISANDSNGANGYWNITLTTPMTPSALQCFGSSYPSISYKHYAGLNVPGPDMTFTSNQCVVSEQTNAVEAGTAAVGTFSGSVVQQTDSGNAPSHTLSAGSYDVIVP